MKYFDFYDLIIIIIYFLLGIIFSIIIGFPFLIFLIYLPILLLVIVSYHFIHNKIIDKKSKNVEM